MEIQHKQLYYSVTINRYKVHINTDDGIVSKSFWATDSGLQEYIEINHKYDPDIPAKYKVTKIGKVQKDEPIPAWRP
jgi:hypothetical protein